MAKPIKCTYVDCYRRFDTVAAMKKHKAKDATHDFYCKRCDVDCTDDDQLMLHQIQSPKHIACPVCGEEFKSVGGMCRHVEVEHPAKQNIGCPGCHARFDSAARLMGHIEKDQCRFISSVDFHKHRVERQMVEDSVSELTNPYSTMAILSESSGMGEQQGGVSLLEGERVSAYPDDLDKYGALPATSRTADTGSSHLSMDPNADLLDVQQAPRVLHPPHPRWVRAAPSSIAESKQTSLTSTYTNDEVPTKQDDTTSDLLGSSIHPARTKQDDTSSDLLGSSVHPANAWHAFQKQNVARSELRRTSASSAAAVQSPESNTGRSLMVRARSGSLNDDPNAHIQVQARAQLRTQCNLQQHWNSIEQVYICPDRRCTKSIRSQEDFEDHLLSGVHASKKVRCPNCLKQFLSITALLSHIESGSIKCRIRETSEIDMVLQQVTAGMIAVKGFGDDGRLQWKSNPVEEW